MNSRWTVIGGAVLVMAALGAMNFKAIRRYIRMSMM
jgi:Family of unknown function (DUF6893)